MRPVKPCHFIPFIILNLIICITGNAQLQESGSNNYYVEHFGEEKGLPQNSVNSILPDNNDFLWIATEGGITRFNGNRFLTVPGLPGISYNNLTRIRSFYYKGKDTIMAYSASNNRVAFIVNNKVVAIEKANPDKLGMLFMNIHAALPLPEYFKNAGSRIYPKWDISRGGYFGMPENKDTFQVLINNGIAVYDSKGPVREISFDKRPVTNVLFLDGEVVYLDDENYLNLYSIAGFKKRVALPIASKNRSAIFNNSFADNFFYVTDSSLYIMDISSGAVVAKKVLSNLQHTDDIHVIYQKDSNTIVIGTQRNGLYVYKKQFFLITDPLPNGESDGFYGQTVLPDNRTVLAGRDKLFMNGRYIGKTKATFLTGAYSSLKDSKGYYWYIYNDHILRAREIGIAVDTMIHAEGNPQILFEDGQGRIWISSGKTFGYFLNNVFTALKFNGLNTGQVSCMRQDAKGQYWIGTREGLFILNNINDKTLAEQASFRLMDIRFIWPEQNGHTWICTYGQGFYLIDKDTVIAFPESNGRLAYAHAIIEDAKGYFWIPTNNGLFVTSRESLMAYVRNINEIPFYYQFSKKQGLRTNEFNGGGQPPYLRWPNGDISLPSMQGLVLFNPATINFNFSRSPILVDNIETDSTAIPQRDEFDVANNVNNISFSLSSSFWGERENDFLEYKVLGKEKKIADGSWLPVDASGKINLFSPSYGNYQLVIRKRTGLRADDYLYRKINFTVLPKWYQTKMFFIARAIFFLLLLTGIFFWRRNYYRNANRILKQKVDAATIELQQMNNTLEKKVEERTLAIQEAELKFRDLAEKSMVGVYIIQDGKFTYVNPRLAEMFGYKQEELINNIITTQLVDAESVDTVNNSIRAKIEGDITSNNYEARGIRKDGQKIWMEIYSSATLFQGKNAVIGSVLDITDRKIAKEQLIKEKDLSNSIINNLPGIFYIFNEKGEYQLWNKNFQTVAGYSDEEMKTIKPADFFEENELPILNERIEKVFKEGYAELEAPFLTKDGRKIPYYFNGITVSYNDMPCVMGVGIDISERRKVEQQLLLEKNLSQSIISILPGVFFVFDKDRVHQLWNKNFETVTGYDPEEMKKKKAGTCVDEKDLEPFAKAIEKMYTDGHAELEVTLINKAKERIPFYVNGISITYDGKPCILAIGIDISERKKAENERERANYLLNERVKELTTLYRTGIVLQREERSIIITLQEIVSILPQGWQYPDITAVRITLGELEFTTPNFVVTPFLQEAGFVTSTGTRGRIQVVYLHETAPEAEGPFLAEERELINMLADMLRIHFVRREAVDALQKSEANLNTIFENTDTRYVLLDMSCRVMAFNQRAADFFYKELQKELKLYTDFVAYFPPERHDGLMQHISTVMQDNPVSYETDYVQPEGNRHWYHIRMFPVTDARKSVFGLMIAVSDITEKKLLEQEILNRSIQEQKMITRAILTGEERERNKIGQELHDNISQILAGTKLYLGMARKNEAGGENIINESMQLLDSAIDEIRALSKGKVTPMKKVNLQELLQVLIDRFHETTNIKTSFIYNGSGQLIEDDLKLNIYRIIQEQLNNILKHAKAANISVLVEAREENIRVRVTDDGKGFDVNSRKDGIGLSNMVNRVASFNGNINIDSSPGNGCRIEINMPSYKNNSTATA